MLIQVCLRFIPAQAGNTVEDIGDQRLAAVHPRAGGEHTSTSTSTRSTTGSSPRRRGTPGIGIDQLLKLRFIPAQAGNTAPDRQGPRRRTVHPRAGGEHPRCQVARWGPYGSSPRRRGTPIELAPGVVEHRFIPAQAGNTSSRRSLAWSRPVHPRAGGEHQIRVVYHPRISGSSPRRRGTRPRRPPASARRRFIPAQAGNTSDSMSGRKISPVHPRAGGEHGHDSCPPWTESGSSPRRRGTQLHVTFEEEGARFIPAQAGNTHHPMPPEVEDAVHPRAGGEHVGIRIGEVRAYGSSPRRRGTQVLASVLRCLHRFIPAQAGNTYFCLLPACRHTVHPRAGGEHLPIARFIARSIGSSPRRRGTLLERDFT